MKPLRNIEKVSQVPLVHLAVIDYRHACETHAACLVSNVTCKLGIGRAQVFASIAMRFSLSTFTCVSKVFMPTRVFALLV